MYFPFGIFVAGIISGMVCLDFIFDFHPDISAFWNYYHSFATNTAPTKHVINVIIVIAVGYCLYRLLTSTKKFIYILFVGMSVTFFNTIVGVFVASLTVFLTQVETRKATLNTLTVGKDDASLRKLQEGIALYHAVILGCCFVMAFLDYLGVPKVQASTTNTDKKRTQ